MHQIGLYVCLLTFFIQDLFNGQTSLTRFSLSLFLPPGLLCLSSAFGASPSLSLLSLLGAGSQGVVVVVAGGTHAAENAEASWLGAKKRLQGERIRGHRPPFFFLQPPRGGTAFFFFHRHMDSIGAELSDTRGRGRTCRYGTENGNNRGRVKKLFFML